ncbi:MAG: histidinol-phosphatase HisJ family protein [Ruminococcus sp.]|nr:histidinol-phosphatase HisJ family protein [Ruminococcus sp.]
MVLIDCHTHTQYSMDSEADIHSCAEHALEAGLAAYGISDHCEVNCWYPAEHYEKQGVDMSLSDYYNYAADFEASLSAVTRLKEEYAGRLNILCGTELGQAHHDTGLADRIVSDERLDYVLGSVHQIRNEKDFYFINYRQYTPEQLHGLLKRYFTEIYELCCWGKIDILSHLDYCRRYMKCGYQIDFDISVFDEIIAEAFRELIKRGKGIEINTSGLRQGFGDTFPGLKYAKLFRELGGEVLSVGSDSHTPEDIGANVRDGVNIAKAAGFEYIAYFRRHEPVFLSIS